MPSQRLSLSNQWYEDFGNFTEELKNQKPSVDKYLRDVHFHSKDHWKCKSSNILQIMNLDVVYNRVSKFCTTKEKISNTSQTSLIAWTWKFVASSPQITANIHFHKKGWCIATAFLPLQSGCFWSWELFCIPGLPGGSHVEYWSLFCNWIRNTSKIIEAILKE